MSVEHPKQGVPPRIARHKRFLCLFVLLILPISACQVGTSYANAIRPKPLSPPIDTSSSVVEMPPLVNVSRHEDSSAASRVSVALGIAQAPLTAGQVQSALAAASQAQAALTQALAAQTAAEQKATEAEAAANQATLALAQANADLSSAQQAAQAATQAGNAADAAKAQAQLAAVQTASAVAQAAQALAVANDASAQAALAKAKADAIEATALLAANNASAASIQASSALTTAQSALAQVPLNAKSFGVRGDGVTDDTAALQAAINAAQTGGKSLVLPAGTYVISTSLQIQNNSFSIEGAGYETTVIKAATPNISSVFVFNDAVQNNRFDFKDFTIDGQNKVSYGIFSNKLAHALFYRVRVLGTNLAGLNIGSGWDNDFDECEVSYNAGDGIVLAASSDNAVNIVKSKIFQNAGTGIKCLGGYAINILGCTIETNAITGIYAVANCNALNIQGCYFESNAQSGQLFNIPSGKNTKSDIILNGSADAKEMHFAFPDDAVTISGNFFNDTTATRSIWLGGSRGTRIVANKCAPNAPVPLSGLYCDSTLSTAPNVTFASNVGFISDCAPENIVANRQMQFSSWVSDNVKQVNYFSDNLFKYSIISPGTGGVIRRSAAQNNGFESFEITGAATSDAFGISLNLDNYPDLQGKTVYVCADVKASNTSCNGAIIINNGSGALSSTSSAASDTNWKRQEFQTVLPTSGTVSFGFRKLSGSSSDIVQFSRPVLAVAGASASNFYSSPMQPNWAASAPPSNGAWNVGDIVRNTVPTEQGIVGSKYVVTGWLCTVAGSPGTWVPTRVLTGN